MRTLLLFNLNIVLRSILQSFLLDPFFSRNIMFLVNIHHISTCFLCSSSFCNLDFNVFSWNESCCSEQSYRVSFFYPFIMEDESFHDSCLVTKNNSCLLSQSFNRNNLNKTIFTWARMLRSSSPGSIALILVQLRGGLLSPPLSPPLSPLSS